jgi:hypothetical protein
MEGTVVYDLIEPLIAPGLWASAGFPLTVFLLWIFDCKEQ